MGERTWRNYKLETSRRSLYFIHPASPDSTDVESASSRCQPWPAGRGKIRETRFCLCCGDPSTNRVTANNFTRFARVQAQFSERRYVAMVAARLSSLTRWFEFRFVFRSIDLSFSLVLAPPPHRPSSSPSTPTKYNLDRSFIEFSLNEK